MDPDPSGGDENPDPSGGDVDLIPAEAWRPCLASLIVECVSGFGFCLAVSYLVARGGHIAVWCCVVSVRTSLSTSSYS